MPTKPPVATVSPLRISRTASRADTTFPPSRARRIDTTSPALDPTCPVSIFTSISVLDPSSHLYDAGRVVHADDDEHGECLDAGHRKDVLVGRLVSKAGDHQERNYRAVVR